MWYVPRIVEFPPLLSVARVEPSWFNCCISPVVTVWFAGWDNRRFMPLTEMDTGTFAVTHVAALPLDEVMLVYSMPAVNLGLIDKDATKLGPVKAAKGKSMSIFLQRD